MKTRIFWISLFILCLAAGFASAHEGHEHTNQSALEEFRTIVTQVPFGLEGAKEMLNLHPLFVHFPIALLLGALVFYLSGRIFKKEGLLAAGKWSLFLGTLTAAVTVWSGLQAAGMVEHGGEVHPIMMMHQYFGIGILILSILLSGWVLISKSNIPQKGQAIFLSLFVLLAFAILQGADLGGRMVYLNGVGVGRKSVVEKKMPEAHEHEEGAHDHAAHSH